MPTFRSAEDATAKARNRQSARLSTFPAKVWAEGHSPGKRPTMVHDQIQLRAAVEQAIGVSRDEFGKDGAIVVWSSC